MIVQSSSFDSSDRVDINFYQKHILFSFDDSSMLINCEFAKKQSNYLHTFCMTSTTKLAACVHLIVSGTGHLAFRQTHTVKRFEINGSQTG
ncbi:uncharacterized protein PHALS_15435 [Plasmopara halstedii]|uniref:Uncharacterized protein n=1 Tax=Plasmopara halstedii TaxID=4781 RepID=A0A0P1AGL6_PLAHL|nr:uncharacterized protein PHALS_15435 [Plasmopara halstedii]CEG40276.1 hypothetical protein PHALS_15435 [Plasmopara halstedii]|eukprot:XP_024576645.1 hypothetical protein PHALS_15435 [Plasmopara halstedii]